MDNEIRIFDEILDEIEYYEILSINDIIKDNPDFKAFSREEIYDELFNFFQNSNTADNLTDLFYKKKNSRDNYVFITDAIKHQYDDNIEEFVNNISKYTKLQYLQSQEAKNKLFFALDYDTDSTALKFKIENKTTLEIQDDKQKYNVFKNDDINIPIVAVYFNRPKYIQKDFFYSKILSKYEKSNPMNLVRTNTFENIDLVVENVKPKIDQILDYLPDDDIDYQTVNNILLSFGSSYDDISVNDFQKLKQHYDYLLKTKEHKVKYKLVQPQILKTHYNISVPIENILHLIPIQYDDIDSLITQLEDEKININFPGLIYNNSYDIINAVKNNDISIEDIIQNIADYRKIYIIENTVNTLLQIKETKHEDIIKILEKERKYQYPSHRDLYDLKFKNFHYESKEVKEANDFSNYDGIPPIYKNDQNFEGMVDRDDDIEVFVPELVSRENILLSQRYKNNNGFRELLEIVLKLFDNIEKNSMLFLNRQALSEELYKHFSGVSTKKDLFINILEKNKQQYPDEYIERIIKLTPQIVLSTQNENITEYIKECNQQYVEILFQMIYISLCWWSISILEDNMNGFLIFDQNKIMVQYIDKWSLSGAPFDKNANDGVIVYLSEITKDILDESVYTSPKNILKSCMKIFEDKYSKELKNIEVINTQKQNKGRESYKILKHVLSKNKSNFVDEYVKALVYMPSYKFKKIHKFLFGCCLQKIGESFVSDSDILGINRTDLKDAKEKFAKKRATIKKSKAMYYIPKQIQVIEKKNIDKIPFDIEQKQEILNDWLDNVESPLLPQNIIEKIQENGTKFLQNEAKKYVEIFIKSSGHKNSNMIDLFQDNHLNLLKRLNKIFKEYNGNSEETFILNIACETVTNIIRDILKLNDTIDDFNKKDINNIKLFILSRAICLPFNPDNSENILKASIEVSHGFIKDLTNMVYKNITKYLQDITMPSIEDNIIFINALREQNKNKQLSEMNKMSMEERQLEKELKSMGITGEQVVHDDIVDADEEDYDLDLGDNEDE